MLRGSITKAEAGTLAVALKAISHSDHRSTFNKPYQQASKLVEVRLIGYTINITIYTKLRTALINHHTSIVGATLAVALAIPSYGRGDPCGRPGLRSPC
jgi:hypothetical protein